MSCKKWVVCGIYGPVDLLLDNKKTFVDACPRLVDFGDISIANEYFESGMVKEVSEPYKEPPTVSDIEVSSLEDVYEEDVVKKRKSRKKKEEVFDEPFEPSL